MKKKIKGILSGLLVITLLLVGCGNHEEIQTPEEYIDENLMEISLSDSWTEGTLGNTEDYQVFLSGEAHGIEEDYEAEKRLIEYLHTYERVCYLIFELSVSEGIILERYIQTGKEELLTEFMDSMAGTEACNQGYYQFLQWLCQYNMSLPEEERLHMFGLDVEFQQDMTIKALQMLDTKEKPDNLEEGALKKAVQAVRDGSSQWYELFQTAVREEPEETEAYYGENWKWAERILKNEEKTFQHISNGTVPESQLRDDNMADNFWFVYDQFPEEKFFGQFGSYHTYLEYTASAYGVEQGHQPFGSLLNQEDSSLEGKVCSILLYNVSNTTEWEEMNRHIAILKEIKLEGRNMLLSLNERRSPFVEEEIWQEEEQELPVCDYIQKIIFLPRMTKSPVYGE